MGTPRVVIDPTRDVAVWRWDLASEAFGESGPNEDPDGDGTAFALDLRFPGQRYDAATGLHHNYFRDYDPTVGRYVQSDPIGLNGGMSTYAYGEGAPLVFSDPLGLQGKGLGGMLGRMIARPMVQRMGGGLLAKAASQAAKARAHARRAAELAQRMQGIWGRITRGGKRGAEEVPQGCGGANISAQTTGTTETIFVTPRGVAIRANTLAQRGSSRLAGNFRALEGASVREIVSRVPRDWTMVPQDRGAGIKFLDARGYERLRLHGPSATAPAGSNSASGWTMRIMDRAGNYYDNSGNIVPYRANDGHIPIFGNPALGRS
jgi:RHS repeat-associated protein